MHVPRKLKVILGIAVVLAAAGVLTFRLMLPRIQTRVVSAHQRSVTRSLVRWVREDGNITNDASAIHAAEMVGYMSTYYVPGEGYHGPPEIEAALERQRQQSTAQLVAALERYTGLAYGTNVVRWTEWAVSRKNELGQTGNSEPVPRRSEHQTLDR
jgi:hypothetical protein